MVANPEFLREGAAVKDFMEPALVVVGGHDAAAMRARRVVYAALDVEPCLVALRTAEMIKYACNAFHAAKIGFANEIGALAEVLGVPPQEVLATLCRDDKLNISAAYLKPGFAFGGSCLPKDLRALRVSRRASGSVAAACSNRFFRATTSICSRAIRPRSTWARADRRRGTRLQGKHGRSSRKPGRVACSNT